MTQETPSPDRQKPRDAVEKVIFETFQDVVDRAPSPEECTEWKGRLLRGVPLRELRAQLEAGEEHASLRTLRARCRAIEATGLFDATWYQCRYPDVQAAESSAIRHYAEYGAREDRWPNPWFDPSWYRTAYRLQGRDDLLSHYLAVGEPNGLRPCRGFDPAWYRLNYPIGPKRSPLADFVKRRHTRTVAPGGALWAALGLREPHLTSVADDVFLSVGEEPADYLVLRNSGLFDENYYALHSGDVLESGVDLLRHYCEFGWRERRQPNFYFDPDWYAATNPEVSRLDVNPLAHYLIAGEPRGRRPIVFFDPVWYRATNGVPAEMSPLAHFLEHRREGSISPNAFFDPVWYYGQKGEPIRGGRDPFARFLVAGMTEDYAPSANFDLVKWRRQSMGRVSRHFRHLLDPTKDNPLVNYLLTTYQ